MTMVYDFPVHHNTISMFLTEVCQAIVRQYADEVVKMLSDEEERRVVNKFNTIDAIDGKHIMLNAPAKSGTIYLN